jgi:hypothetical protein
MSGVPTPQVVGQSALILQGPPLAAFAQWLAVQMPV